MPLLAGEIEVPHSTKAHDPVPFQVFLEHAECLGLVHIRGQFVGVIPVRAHEEDTLMEQLEIPYFKVARRRDEATVVIVWRAAQRIIILVYLTAGLEEADLVVIVLENPDGLFCLYLETVEIHVLLHHAGHAGLDPVHVFLVHLAAVRLVEFAVISVRNGMLDVYAAALYGVFGGLAEQEEKRPVVGAHAVA